MMRKKNSYKTLSIKTKLLTALLAIGGIGFILGLYSMVKNHDLSELITELYYHPYSVSNTARDIHINIITMHRDMKDVTLNDSPKELEALIQKVDALEAEVIQDYTEIYYHYLGDPNDIRRNELLFKNWRPIREEIIALTKEHQIQKAAFITKNKGARYVKEMTDSIQSLILNADNKAYNFYITALKEQSDVIKTTLIFFILLIIITILALYFAQKNILSPLTFLARLMQNFQNQRKSIPENKTLTTLLKREDEIGLLFNTFYNMRTATEANLIELDLEKNYSHAVIESNSTAIIAINKAGVITTFNKKAEELFGYSKEEMLGTININNIIPHEYLQKHHLAFQKFIQGHSQTIDTTKKDLYAKNKDGAHFPVQISFGLHRWDGETVIIANIVDVSIEKELTQQLKERSHELMEINHSLEVRVNKEVLKNKLQLQQNFNQAKLAQMGEMISMIAHQWRQPLSAISSITSHLLIKLELSPSATTPEGISLKEHFQTKLYDVDNLIQVLSNTIDDFRTFYKPDKEKKTLQIEEPIEKTLKIIQPALSANAISLEKRYNSTKLLSVHESELMQVLINIIKNAEDNFLENKILAPKISINTYDTKEGVTIEICDNGGGIPDTIIDKIFTPYFSTKNEKNGTGLGLYMSKTIIEEHHNGTLSIINQAQGCCFIITL